MINRSSVTVHILKAKEMIFKEGEPYRYVAVVAKGAVKRCVADSEGGEKILSLAFPSSFLGMPFVDFPPYNVEAATDVVLCRLDKAKFETLIVEKPHIERNWLVTMLGEYERLQQFVHVLHPMRASERIASFFLAFCKETPIRSTYNISIPISRMDIAALLGTTQETISRFVQSMARDKTISIVDNRYFVVHNLPILEKSAGNSLAGVGTMSYGSVRSRLFRSSIDGIDANRRARRNKLDVRSSFRPRTGSAPPPSRPV